MEHCVPRFMLQSDEKNLRVFRDKSVETESEICIYTRKSSVFSVHAVQTADTQFTFSSIILFRLRDEKSSESSALTIQKEIILVISFVKRLDYCSGVNVVHKQLLSIDLCVIRLHDNVRRTTKKRERE